MMYLVMYGLDIVISGLIYKFDCKGSMFPIWFVRKYLWKNSVLIDITQSFAIIELACNASHIACLKQHL